VLTESFITARQKDLLKEKSRLEKEISSLPRFEQYGESDDDNAVETQKFEENLSVRANLERLLGEVNKALAKIEKGTYGKCEKGPEEIEADRLEAFPSATVCLKHQKETERRIAKPWWKPWAWRR